jgi:hypothetical protein
MVRCPGSPPVCRTVSATSSSDRLGAVTGPDQQLPGLRRVEVVQGHQDAGRCGDPLPVTQRGPHLVTGAGVGQPGGAAFPVHDRGGVIGQRPDKGGIGITWGVPGVPGTPPVPCTPGRRPAASRPEH